MKYSHGWYLRYKDSIRKATYRWRKDNPEHYNDYVRRYNKTYPWSKWYSYVKQICENPKSNQYHNYGGKGIKNKLTVDKIKFLWMRDQAYLMERPSLNRKNEEQAFSLKNCFFKEFNTKKHASKHC